SLADWKDQSSNGPSKEAEESHLSYFIGYPIEHQLLCALGIDPKDPTYPFVAHPAGDLVIDFVNNLGYPEELQFVSKIHNIHKRLQSPLHITTDDYSLGNLKFVPKGGLDEVFGMPIPKDLLTDVIRNAEYYQKYLEMAVRKPRQPTTITDEESVKKKTVSPADKSKKPAPAKQTKYVKEKSTKPTPSKKAIKDEEPLPAPEPPADDDEYNLQRGIQMSFESFQPPVVGVAIHEPTSGVTQSLPVVEVIEEASTGPSREPQDDTSVNVVHDTPLPTDAETGADTKQSNSKADTEILNVAEEQGEDVSNTVALEERIVKLDEGQARSDPGNTLESRPPPDEDQAGSNPGQSHVAIPGPNPEPMHEYFIATVYPKVHESLKHTTEEHVFMENPPSSSGLFHQ
ncbi:hypothetical protein Tco_1234095, partial [Tanacetum coccineum]